DRLAVSAGGVLYAANSMAVVSDDTFIIGCQDAINNRGLVYYTNDSGWTYSTGVAVGNHQLYSIALSPDYEENETILVGNTNGLVYWSSDNGTSFEPLPLSAPSPLTNSISVAFDPEFGVNNTVYAASNTKVTTTSQERIYRFIIGRSTKWESIDSTLSDGTIIDRLAVSAGGVLYAANSMADSGMQRSLNPTYSLGPKFETVTRGLDKGAKLRGLWLYGNQLWAIDTNATSIMTYADSLTIPVTLTSPSAQAAGIDTKNVRLEWETLGGATKYEWQLDYDTDFSDILDKFKGEPEASSSRLSELEPATTYYWRVRVAKPVLSPWSAKSAFTTRLGTNATTAPKLYSPEAGASTVPLKPVFQWDAIAGADSYELLVSTYPSFSNPLIIKVGDYALPSTAWQCDMGLDYASTYYWKVRAIGSDTQSAWSAVGAFTTESPPELKPSPITELPAPSLPPVVLPPPSSSPASLPLPAQQVIPEWVIFVIGALLLTMILLVIVVLVLATGIRRA
ncbi:hypothetical protein ACFLTZ_02750, partial [Chloroflexota bacterium]